MQIEQARQIRVARRARAAYRSCMLDFDNCNTARLNRDPAFDGQFVVAVKTTKIYCRPVCPAGPALTKNVTFYPSATEAEKAGYRACLRCKPEGREV